MSKQESLAWKSVDWPLVTKRVRRIQRRIYKASQSNSINRVHWLQKLLINSLDCKLLAVRTVTTGKKSNKGKITAGLSIGKTKYLSDNRKWELVKGLSVDGKAPPPEKKKGGVWIPKPGKPEDPPLGIPTIRDRAKQAVCKFALEPEWEAKFEANSYGFRPGRSAQDAIEAIFLSLRHGKPKWVFGADVSKCFDRIDHGYLLAKLNTFKLMEDQVSAWLKAGIMDPEVDRDKLTNFLVSTKSCAIPKGIVSPLLSNIALHGLENNLKTFLGKLEFSPSVSSRGRLAKENSLTVVRYADDFVIFHTQRHILDLCVKEVHRWFAEAGLEISDRISEEKSSIKDCRESFLFLGFHIIQVRKNNAGYKVSIKPSNKNCTRYLDTVSQIIQKNRAVSTYTLITLLRPVVIGWANYFRSCECSESFSKMTHLLFQKIRHWVFRRHPREGRETVKERYWPSGKVYQYNGRSYKDNWVLRGQTRSNRGMLSENYLPHMSWILHRKHVKIQGTRSPYDSDYAYWASRNSKHSAYPLRISKLFKLQNGRCTICNQPFDTFSQLEVDHIVPKALGGRDFYNNLQLLHESCHLKKTAVDKQEIANARRGRTDLQEPYEVKVSRTDLKTGELTNETPLV